MNLNLRINDYPITLNQALNESELQKHDFKKAGFLERQLIKPDKNEVIWWAKNPSLKYLDDDLQNAIHPILDIEAGAHIMFGTSAYLWFRESKLTKLTFQIIQNKTAAEIYLKKLEEKLTPLLNPTSTEGPLVIWEMGDQDFVIEYPQGMHGYIHLVSKD